jgi:hypothetical protein
MTHLKPLVAEILKLTDNDAPHWDIYDVQGSLALAHYNPEVDAKRYGWIKGVIVDHENGKIVCQTYGAPDNVTLTMGKDLQYIAGKVDVKTELGEIVTLKESKIKIMKGYDGHVVRVFYYMGVMHIASYKRIDSDDFTKLYYSLAGPTMNELFPSPNYHSTIYPFLIIEPWATRYDGPQELLYLGSPSPLVKIFRTPETLTLAEANKFLKHGYYPPLPWDDKRDPRLTHGEFVMVFIYENDVLSRCIRIKSSAYDWRSLMRNNDPDLAHLVYCLASQRAPELSHHSEREWFKNRYLPLALPDVDDLPYITPKLIPIQDVSSVMKETYIASLVFATPPKLQPLVLDAFDDYLSFIPEAVDWIIGYQSSPDDDPHVVKLIQEIRDKATVDDQRERILFLLGHLNGDALYKLRQLKKK